MRVSFTINQQMGLTVQAAWPDLKTFCNWEYRKWCQSTGEEVTYSHIDAEFSLNTTRRTFRINDFSTEEI
jgi:hypothetical protein